MDWGVGNYERQAGHLVPAVQEMVDAVAPWAGGFVVDVGCGSGTAALLVAEVGGVRVTGIDPAPRLLEVARTDAEKRGLDVEFVEGEAARLPLPDHCADAVVSSFALIFVPDPETAIREIARVLKPGGRLVFSAWLRTGARARQAQLRVELVGDDQAPPALFAWNDPETVAALVTPLGFTLTSRFSTLPQREASPRAAAEAQLRDLPLWVQARPGLEANGRWERALPELTRIFEEENEDPEGFLVTSRFVIHTAVLNTVPSETP